MDLEEALYIMTRECISRVLCCCGM